MKKISVLSILMVIILGIISGCGKPVQQGGKKKNSNTNGEEITIAIFGGEWGEAIKNNIVSPFEEETGIKVKIIEGNSTTTYSRLGQEKGASTVDLALMDSGISELAVKDGILEEIEKDKIKDNESLYPEAFHGVDDEIFGIALGYWGLGIAYNTEKVKNPPNSWEDLWNEEYQGNVTIPTPATTGGFPLLLQVSELVGDQKGEVEQGLNRISELEVVAYFDSSGAATNLYQSGEATVGAHYGGPTYVMKDQGQPIEFVVPKEGVLGAGSFWHIVNGTEKLEQVYTFLNYATAKSAQEGIAEELFLAPIHMEVELDEETMKKMPYGEGGTLKDINMPDYELINEHRDEWNELWNRKIGS